MTETFNQLPITYSADAKAAITTSSTSDDISLQERLDGLNGLHKALTASNSDAQNGVPPPPNVVNPKRSANVNKLRESGNTAYRARKYQDALRMYSLAIDMALQRPGWEPVGLVGEELSGLYASRAQAHIALNNWPEGALDAQCSAELKPLENPKARWRRGKCLLEMGLLDQADDWVNTSLELTGEEPELKALAKEISRKKEASDRRVKLKSKS